ncbi:protein ECERIFERUM 26-like [Silene latifolia]|uniref:protein ECERIFERUM 26-like n=1 Tax=Silene latifolia TaxID=37657 RepID=UPI003D77129D
MGESVTFLRKRTLVSTKPVQPPCKIHQLSALDLMMEKHHLNIIHYYNTPLGLQLGELSTKIRDNLSETLSYFPVVMGRLTKDNINNDMGKWVIKCNDAGLRFVEAKAKGSVEEWLENLDDEKENMLVHWEDMCHVPYHWSTFYIKVTEFEEGGLALGLSCAHMITDSVCATLFLKAVTDILVNGRVSVPPFFHSLPRNNNNNRLLLLNLEKSHQNPNNYLINTYKSYLESPSPLTAKHYKTIALEFKDDMVQSCMNLAQLNGPTNDAYSPACIALIGLLWNCISRVKGMRHGLIDMSICSNMRKILGLDQGFFGNCMIYNKVYGNGTRVDDLMSSIKAIKDAIENVNKDDILELIEWLEHYNRDHSSSFVVDGDKLEFINLEDMDPYSNIFTQGYEPIRVSYYSESGVEKDKVLILPWRPNEGQLSKIVMITLPSDEVIKLCEDQHLTRYSPLILMDPKHK